MDPICRKEFNAQEMVKQYPAELHDRNKEIVFKLSNPRRARHKGTISFSRWPQMPLPESVRRESTRAEVEVREEYFTYDPSPPGQVDWHLNFAHYDLFCAYGSPLFAQDEMQVTEHPALASLRHALIDSGIDPLTVEYGEATPILIMGVERRCTVATDPNPAAGRPFGLYGNHFSFADERAIREATQVFRSPTISNILAIEAPAVGQGRYTREQIEFVLATAYTGFRAAVIESKNSVSPTVQTVIHTGYWGCGAYGGNRELMPMLQIIAALLAGVDTLIFHTGGDVYGIAQSVDTLEKILPADVDMNRDELISTIDAIGYDWGVSDGN